MAGKDLLSPYSPLTRAPNASKAAAPPSQRRFSTPRKKEISQVDRKAVSVAGLAAVALLVAVTTFGCANRGGAVQPAGHTPAVRSSQGDKAASTPTPTPVDTAATNPTDDPGAADDSLAGDLSDLESSLGGINGALSGSEAGPSGGE
jgi:hypothetical protein